MKNNRLYPFERNRFFYGKLLTVRDFEAEQKYFNDKRRLLNRLTLGEGVVSGLNVVAIDDLTVSVEPGLAIDSYGREIVVGFPVTQKLSMIDGFTNNDYSKNVYLCLDYDEKGKEAVHSVASSATTPESVSEYNRVLESYRLFIKEDDPDVSTINFSNLVETTMFLYRDPQVRIWQTVPRYVNPGESFEVVVKIEKALQVQKLDLKFEVELDGLTAKGKNTCKVSFSESLNSKETQYEVRYLLKADMMPNRTGKISIKSKSVKLKAGDNVLNAASDCSGTVECIEQPVRRKTMDNYLQQSFEKSLAGSADNTIYLARISLLQVGPTYMIEKVEQVPFGQYVYNSALLNKLVLPDLLDGGQGTFGMTKAKAFVTNTEPGEEPSVRVAYNEENAEMDFQFRLPSPRVLFGDVTTGTLDIDLGDGAKAGASFYSEEIDHNLGLGQTYIELTVVDQGGSMLSEMTKEDERIFCGESDVFDESPYSPNVPAVSMGAVIYPKKGKFRIGVKVKKTTRQNKIRIRWWAYKKLSESGRAGGINVLVNPETAKIGPGERIQLKAAVMGTGNQGVLWGVTKENGGLVDFEGFYTAPQKPGVYEIEAVSEEDPTKSAVAIIEVEGDSGAR